MSGKGIYDIHCHIVPGVDDGATDIEETGKLLRMEYEQGVRTIIATPHFRFRMFETSAEKVKEQFKLVEKAAAEVASDLHVYLGCEFHTNMEMISMLRENKVMPGMEERSMMEKTIKKDIWEMISSVSYSTHIAGNAGRADQKFFEHLQEGIADNDLDKIYEFIDAYERGKSIKPDELVCRLFQKAYREDSARLCQLLAEKNNIVDYWIFLSTCCETDMLVDFAKMDVAYPCFYYECARILLKRTSGIDEKCKEAIIAAVKRIADRDLALWERWVQRKEHNTNWQQLLFSVLSKVSREALKRFAQTINLDMMLQNHKEDIVAWEFERLSDTSKKYILENISKDILENWNLLFEKKKKKHENLREIWFSGYFSLILNSLQYDLKNKEEWKLSFLNYEKILEKDMYAWYEKTTHMCCAFFYDITQIFYIVLAGQEKQIIEADESVTQSIRKIQLFIRRHEDYWKDHVKQKIELEHRLEAML